MMPRVAVSVPPQSADVLSDDLEDDGEDFINEKADRADVNDDDDDGDD